MTHLDPASGWLLQSGSTVSTPKFARVEGTPKGEPTRGSDGEPTGLRARRGHAEGGLGGRVPARGEPRPVDLAVGVPSWRGLPGPAEGGGAMETVAHMPEERLELVR